MHCSCAAGHADSGRADLDRGWGVRESAMVARSAMPVCAERRADRVVAIGAGALLLGVAGGAVWIGTTNRAERRMVPEAVAAR